MRNYVLVGRVFLLLGAIVLIAGCGKQEVKIGLDDEKNVKLSGSSVPEKGSEKMGAQKGSKVKVQYTGKLADGTIFDKSQDNDPLKFTLGSGSIIPGFENAVEGMQLNEEKQVIIAATDAYGERNEGLVREFPNSAFPEDFVPQKGMMISLGDPSGKAIPATIVEVSQENVKVDLNHPLAGKELVFDIKVVSVE
ncbi:MAG: peptidylprolyl isomerase [Candidatus Omnitrophota bacterium]|nr:peptidylprolyl isomerase [Candidatus Omnitrophota bacterium]